MLTTSSDEIRFDGLTFQKSDDGMNIEVLVDEDGEQAKRIKFQCKRVTDE